MIPLIIWFAFWIIQFIDLLTILLILMIKLIFWFIFVIKYYFYPYFNLIYLLSEFYFINSLFEPLMFSFNISTWKILSYLNFNHLNLIIEQVFWSWFAFFRLMVFINNLKIMDNVLYQIMTYKSLLCISCYYLCFFFLMINSFFSIITHMLESQLKPIKFDQIMMTLTFLWILHIF